MKFSILIPAYKGTFLCEALESCLSQTYQTYEVVVVDDASPENLVSIVEPYLKDERVRYFRNEKNCGAINVVDNWNICLKYANGDYVICMGDDDMLDIDCLQTYASLIEKHPAVHVFHCRSNIIDERSEIKSLTHSWPEQESVYANIWHRMTANRQQYIGDFLYHRQYLIECGGFYKLPMAWASDDITAFKAMDHGIIHTQKTLFNYRETQCTLSNSGNAFIKVTAINQEYQWYVNFVNSARPQMKEDKIFLNCIKEEIPHHFKIKQLETVAYVGIGGNLFFGFFYWLWHRDVAALSILEVMYALLLAIKKKMK